MEKINKFVRDIGHVLPSQQLMQLILPLELILHYCASIYPEDSAAEVKP